MNEIVKFTGKHDNGELFHGWHLVSLIGDGEFTACGLAVPEYEHKSKKGTLSKITCKKCKDVIEYYKKLT